MDVQGAGTSRQTTGPGDLLFDSEESGNIFKFTNTVVVVDFEIGVIPKTSLNGKLVEEFKESG